MKRTDPFSSPKPGAIPRLASPPCYLAEFDFPDPGETNPDPAPKTPPAPMSEDRLYLIRPSFFQDDLGPFYCPGCAEVLGLLEHYPSLRDRVSLHYVDFARPRPDLVDLLGEEFQSCPVLILGEDHGDLPSSIQVQHAKGHSFIEGAREIGTYFARVYSTGFPF